jgi:hypothetical protein
LISDKHGAHEGIRIGDNIDPQGDIALMTFDMHRFVVDIYDDDNGDDDEDDDNRIDANNIDDNGDTLDEEDDEEPKNDENMQHKKRIITPDSSEWGTCPNCKGCGFVGNICSESFKDGMKFERHPIWYYNDAEGVIHMIDIKRRIIFGKALVSIVIGKVMLSTPKTAV